MLYAKLCLFIIIITFTIYIWLDGKALALCSLLPFADKKQQIIIFNHILPAWDANQTWLVFTLAALYGAFSPFFGQILSGLYLWFISLLLLLILRGAAIELAMKEQHRPYIWYTALSISSVAILIIQSGVVAYLILQQQIVNFHVIVNPIARSGYYLLAIVLLLMFHFIQALDQIQYQLRFCSRPRMMLTLGILFTCTLLYFDIITGFYRTHYWYIHLAITILLLGDILFLRKLTDKYCIRCYCLTIGLLSLVIIFLYLYPFHSIVTKQSLLSLASNIITMKIISIASLILLPCLFASMLLLNRVFKQTDDAISY